jgi:hypothetical protein
MRNATSLILLFGSLVLAPASPVRAQHKVQRPAALWPEIQLDYVFRSTSFLFFRNHYRHVLDPDLNRLREHGALQYLERLQVRLGYEHVFGSNWTAGISESYALERNRNILFQEVYGRHTGAIGLFRFSQRASFEHIMRWPKKDNGRFRLRAELERSYQVAQHTLRPRASYEVFFNIDYHAPVGTQSRQLDRTRLRLDCQLVLNNFVALTPYFIRQTDYYLVAPALPAGNRAVSRQNQVTPIYGLEFRYSAFAGGAPFPRTLPFKK